MDILLVVQKWAVVNVGTEVLGGIGKKLVADGAFPRSQSNYATR
jgi:hypothetical protein